MKDRLQEIIKYKTGGKQTPFAELLGWSPQYLAKLLRGNNFGLQPVLTLLSSFPEINARWFLFGEGAMIDDSRLVELQRGAFQHLQNLFALDKYIPYMSGEELKTYEDALIANKTPDFDPLRVAQWQAQLDTHTQAIDARFADATAKSDETCRQKIAK